MGTASKGGLSPARSGSLAGKIANTLQDEIIAGRYKPGQRLVEREIIERFGVSSIHVREAFLDLEGRGLLVRRHNVGCSVIELTPKEAARICELRRTLEPKVVEWACERISDGAIAGLEKQLVKLERAASRRQLPSFFQEDIAFHRMIWAAADNPFAARSLDIVMGSLFAAGLIGGEQKATINLVAEVEKHRRLVEAIRQRDARSAAMALLDIAVGFEKNVPHMG
ncbi:MAG: GntR family transcriptional regulator [Bryobacteraceae bacterium]|nr:GntR family transcriptional regulator [Bryobacteraceae bacterium]